MKYTILDNLTSRVTYTKLMIIYEMTMFQPFKKNFGCFKTSLFEIIFIT